MSFRGHLRPGQGFRPLTVWRREGGVTATGRPYTGELTEQGTLLGIITQCSPEEIDQFKQNGHPVTHTIVQRGTKNRAKETDVLEVKPKVEGGDSRYFLVQTVHDPAELGHFTVYKALERSDLQ